MCCASLNLYAFICHVMSFIVSVMLLFLFVFFFFKQKTAYELRISDWSSVVCSSDLLADARARIVLAGVLLADSEYRHELQADIEPFKGQIGRASCRERVCQYV